MIFSILTYSQDEKEYTLCTSFLKQCVVDKIVLNEIILNETINAPISNVWKTLSDFGAVDKWAPQVKKSIVDGQGIGTTRTCIVNIEGMGEFDTQEVLEVLDENSKILSYRAIDSPVIPIKNGIATWKLDDIEKNQTKITYKLSYESSDIPYDEMKQMISNNFGLTLKGLEKISL